MSDFGPLPESAGEKISEHGIDLAAPVRIAVNAVKSAWDFFFGKKDDGTNTNDEPPEYLK
jgi:hypothetical protein